jgi:GTP cyclohydrolase FolE2
MAFLMPSCRSVCRCSMASRRMHTVSSAFSSEATRCSIVAMNFVMAVPHFQRAAAMGTATLAAPIIRSQFMA